MIGEDTMSFVLCVCGMDYSIMVGDSCMIAFDKNKAIQTVDENVRKVLRINENISIGYAGDPVAISAALQEFDSYDRGNLTLGQVKKIFVDKIKVLSTNKLGAKIIISGKNKYGKILMYVLDKKQECKIEKYEPKPSLPVFFLCRSGLQCDYSYFK